MLVKETRVDQGAHKDPNLLSRVQKDYDKWGNELYPDPEEDREQQGQDFRKIIELLVKN